MIEGIILKTAAAILGAFLALCVVLTPESFQREDIWLDRLAMQRALIRERAEFNLHYAEDITEQIVHSACVETCQSLDWDTDNRDGPKFAYTCIGHGPRGFTCTWENLDENLRPKRVRGVR